MTNGKKHLPEFHPQTVLRDWGNGEGFRLSDALTGACVFGATGSGKTSGPAKHLAYGYLAAGFGGLVLCAKKEERRQWEQWAAETERTDDLVIIDASGHNNLAFCLWEQNLEAEAYSAYKQSLELKPDNVSSLRGACYLGIETDHDAEAVEYCRRFSCAVPQDSEAAIWYATALWNAKLDAELEKFISQREDEYGIDVELWEFLPIKQRVTKSK
ncbi:MAG TPA: hypothetical protein VIK35_09250 [Verrucomicrobiae bacterium]